MWSSCRVIPAKVSPVNLLGLLLPRLHGFANRHPGLEFARCRINPASDVLGDPLAEQIGQLAEFLRSLASEGERVGMPTARVRRFAAQLEVEVPRGHPGRRLERDPRKRGQRDHSRGAAERLPGSAVAGPNDEVILVQLEHLDLARIRRHRAALAQSSRFT
jgi:hypothetical protein